MSEHFNNLRPEQLEALAILAEECGEVIQVVGKILRHGLYSHHPAGGPNNAETLTAECGDVLAAFDLVESVGVFHTASLQRARLAKLQRVERYLHHIEAPMAVPK